MIYISVAKVTKMEIAEDTLLNILIDSLNLETIHQLNKSILNLKLVCKRFNRILGLKRFWQEFYLKIGYVNDIPDKFDPERFFGLLHAEYVMKVIYWNALMVIMEYKYIWIYKEDKELIKIDATKISFSGNYMLTYYEGKVKIYRDDLTVIREEHLEGSVHHLFEWEGPGIMAIHDKDEYIDLHFADSSYIRLGNGKDKMFYVPPLSNGILYRPDKFKFYNFKTQTEKTLSCVSTKEGTMYTVSKYGIVIIHEPKRIFAIKPEEDRIIWELNEELSSIEKIDVQDYGLFTLYVQFKIHIFDSQTGKRIRIFDISHLHNDPNRMPGIKIMKNRETYIVSLYNLRKLQN